MPSLPVSSVVLYERGGAVKKNFDICLGPCLAKLMEAPVQNNQVWSNERVVREHGIPYN